MTRTFRLVLEYAGAGFEGWQAQSGTRPARTVQGELEKALASIGCERVRVRGAGRTDAGVHALAQVASARFEAGPAPEVLARALNARLPSDVAVLAADAVPADWDALREARGKHYRYQIWNGRTRSPLREARWWWVNEPLDLAEMRAAAALLVGRHDFASFQGTGSSVRTTVRRVESLEIVGVGGGEIQLEVSGEGFLRHMVRNLAGTLVEVGRGRWSPLEVDAILAARDRGRAGPTAPAHGLLLVAVRDSFSEGLPVPPESVDFTGPVG
jgi:tRNA pseudouridine38-40 synthase